MKLPLAVPYLEYLFYSSYAKHYQLSMYEILYIPLRSFYKLIYKSTDHRQL